MDHDLPGEAATSIVSRPKLHVVSMVRNEADLFAPFLCQVTRLFDKVLLVDHKSTDGTRQIADHFISEGAKIEVFDLNERGYYQAEVSDLIARKAFQEGADWCFFLDADEFIDVEDGAALRRLLSTFDSDVMTLPWTNLVPTNLGTFTSFDISQAFRWDGQLSRYGKVAISSSYAAMNPNFHVHQGNHAVSATRGQDLEVAHNGIRLLHIPIRSIDRLTYKLAAGMQAYHAKNAANGIEGFHWFELHDRLQRGTVEKRWLNGVIANYAEPLQSIKPVDPMASKWEVVRLPGNVHLATPVAYATTLPETTAADERQSWIKSTSIRGTVMRAEFAGGGIVMRLQPMRGENTPYNGTFDPLPLEERPASDSLSYRQLAEALSSAFDPIKTLVPSAWTEHAPLLFVLFSLLRPRRYVEIGTHWGMSFFAACQAAEHLGLDTQCVGVDGWFGDKHAGFYDDNVFEQFASILKAKYPQQLYIRSLFDEAAPCFADQSIDLLLIDGLHTYDAVKNDFDTWLPKMSKRGVILFHDISFYENDFGVWRLWDELKAKYPHFQALHSHGLGIIYVGEEPSAFAAALRSLEHNRDLETLVISFMAKIGAMSTNQTKLSDELTWSRNEQERSRNEQEQLTQLVHMMTHSTSWAITGPVRGVGHVLKRVLRRM